MAKSGHAYDKSRRAAVAALTRVHQGGWAALAAGALGAASLTARDRAFAGALFYGTAERLYTLDYLLAPYLKKPLAKIDREIRAILESGLYQMLYMRVPPSAAVNESVKLVRVFGKSSATGLVNAVLRRAAADMATDTDASGPDFSNMVFENEWQRVCVQYSVSPVVAKAVMQALPDEYQLFFEASFSKGELCLRCNTLQNTPQQLATALEKMGACVRPGQLADALYAQIPGGVAEDALFEQGRYHVQGEASQYVCANVEAAAGQRVLDLCAAPGGKTATLAQQMAGGQGLTSCDVRPNRLPLITENLHRLHLPAVTVLANDATQFNAALEGQDAVLCDVPCSGLGVLAQKPDMRMGDGAGFEQLPALQLSILCTAARYVKTGGRLIYSTCTIRPEENQQVVQAFLQKNRDFSLRVPKYIPKGAILRQDMMTLLPHRVGMDGFFVATMVRL